MTLVYAKIIGMFVCGAEPGGRGWGVGAGAVTTHISEFEYLDNMG